MMKKLFCLMLCLCTLFSFTLPAAKADDKVYVALGDSITTGYALKNVKNECFANLLANQLGCKLINRAINGNTTVGLMLQLNDKTLQSAIQSANVVTITIGGNDMLALFYSAIINTYNTLSGGTVTLTANDVASIMSNPSDSRQMMLMMCAQTVLLGNPTAGIPSFIESDDFKNGLTMYTTALTGIVSSIHAINPGVPVIVATQYNPYAPFDGMYAALNTGFDTGVRLLNQAITDNAEAGNYLIADVYSVISGVEENLYNAAMEPLNLDIHPNAAGHKVIFECFLDVAAPVI